MSVSRTVQIVLILIGIPVVAAGLIRWIAGFHQRRVTRSLAAWTPEVANITNDALAIHAAEMLRHLYSCYLPGGEYRGPEAVEAALQRQRRQSIERVVGALEAFAGLDDGTNAVRWADWAAGHPVAIQTAGQPPTRLVADSAR